MKCHSFFNSPWICDIDTPNSELSLDCSNILQHKVLLECFKLFHIIFLKLKFLDSMMSVREMMLERRKKVLWLFSPNIIVFCQIISHSRLRSSWLLVTSSNWIHPPRMKPQHWLYAKECDKSSKTISKDEFQRHSVLRSRWRQHTAGLRE